MEFEQRDACLQICVLTTTRADYGIFRPLLSAFSADADLELRLAVSGTHLSEALSLIHI